MCALRPFGAGCWRFCCEKKKDSMKRRRPRYCTDEPGERSGGQALLRAEWGLLRAGRRGVAPRVEGGGAGGRVALVGLG